MRREVREEERALIAEARAEAEQQAASIAAESADGVEVVRRDAAKRVPRGVARVLEAIVSGA